jgi:hypothetical protein
MQTLLLDSDWDLVVDVSGNIAVAPEPLSMAQDAASAIRTFAGEVYFDTTLGIPYFSQVLGYAPPVSLMKAYFNQAAMQVPGVASAATFITSWQDRIVSGQVQITDSSGNVTAAGF